MVEEAARVHNVELEELRDRVSWLVRLRWIAVLGVFGTIALTPRLFDIRLNERSLYLVTAGLAGYNAIAWAIGRFVPAATQGRAVSYFANAQISLDLLFLTGLLHLSGGVENPFAYYYVFHVVIGSILLSRIATYLQAGLAVALFATMILLEGVGILPHHHIEGFLPLELCSNPIYIIGSLVSLSTTLALCAFMATSITSRLRRREAEIVHLSSALQKHAEDLAAAYEDLREVDREQTEYLHRVAHHLRSPLASVEQMLAVVSEGRTGAIPAKSQEMLERSRVRLRQMIDLARDLLVLSRARASSPVSRRDRVDLAHLVRQIAGEAKQQAAATGVAVSESCPDAPVEVEGDLEALAEVVENLVGNAVKYTPAGGTVRVALTTGGAEVALAVSDTGIGIPGAEREHIFEEFYRGANARESGKDGTGLGLSIAKAIVEAHGGAIRVEAAEGQGTVFRVVLPLRSAQGVTRP